MWRGSHSSSSPLQHGGRPPSAARPELRFVAWHPDGERVTFTGVDGDLYWMRADGSGEAERLTTSDANARSSHRVQVPTSWSPDGRTLVFTQRLGSAASVNRDIWALTLGDSAPAARPFLVSAADESSAELSPDGRYLAYESNQSGRSEVYVQPFPGSGRRELVSTDGGGQPVWARNGRELFYRAPGPGPMMRMMAVDVRLGEVFTAGRPRVLWEAMRARYPGGHGRQNLRRRAGWPALPDDPAERLCAAAAPHTCRAGPELAGRAEAAGAEELDRRRRPARCSFGPDFSLKVPRARRTASCSGRSTALMPSGDSAMRGFIVVVLCLLVHPCSTFAEVTSVTVTSRTTVAGGQSFGATGPYERLVGRIEFALDPADPHNVGIVDLNHAPRDADGRVHFSSDLYVLRPTDPAKGNGVLLFEVANRGSSDPVGTVQSGRARRRSDDRRRSRRRPADARRLHAGVDRMGVRRPRPAAPDRGAAGAPARRFGRSAQRRDHDNEQVSGGVPRRRSRGPSAGDLSAGRTVRARRMSSPFAIVSGTRAT